ncbi:MAG: hypothetical protein F4227_10310 [Gammaproteobacteria bacterium]|nr:hypothetical protein [Gammaproteobacteria bacterium]MYF03332.1 hypothetical protein [Gammaproteobacteria bacterium]MYI77320.1 hypothetical protein [Gammaproteobacteria bacterium]
MQRTGSILMCLARSYVALCVCLIVSACATVDFEYRFDDESDRFGEASLWDDWYETVQRTNDELVAIEACIEDESKCDRDMRRIRVVVINGKKLQPAQQLQLVNRYINRMRRYNDDRRVYKELEDSRLLVRQQWSTLLDFMQKGGDCEDFATAKYALLKLIGFDTHDLRIVVVYDQNVQEYHAVIAVRTDEDQVALLDIDNKIYSQRPPHYRFVYSINEHSIWDHSLEDTRLPRALRKRQSNGRSN